MVLSSVFLKQITGNRFMISFISLILFQEVYVSGYYPNSSMIAMALLSIALLLTTGEQGLAAKFLSGVVFAIAVWIRFDAILTIFAFAFIYLNTKGSFIKSFFVFCATSVVASLLLFSVSGVSILNIIKAYSEHAGNNINIRGTLNIYSTIFTFAIILGYAFGLCKLYQYRKWRLILLSVLAPLPLMFAYGFSVTSPKYLLYASVLWAIPISYSMNLFAAKPTIGQNRLIMYTVILLFIGQYIFTPPYELVLERSTIIHTADGARLRGTIAYTPIYYAKYRRATLTKDIIFQQNLKEYLWQNNPSYFISQDWMTNQWLLYFLQNNNYRIKGTENFSTLLEDGQRLILTRGSNTVYLVRWRPETSLDLPSSLQDEIKNMPSILYIGPDYITTDYAHKCFLSDNFDWQRLPNWGRCETVLFEQ